MTMPNVVCIMFDQMSAKWLEAAGAGACPVPHMQRLQAMGTTFTQAYTSNPVCCPARATLATGLTSRQHGLLRNGMGLDPRLPTFMRILQDAGWASGAFGKVHLPPPKLIHPGDAFDEAFTDYRCFGFDAIHITEDHRRGEWLEWIRREHAPADGRDPALCAILKANGSSG